MMTKLGNERVVYKQFTATQSAIKRKDNNPYGFADFYRDRSNLIGETKTGKKYLIDLQIDEDGNIKYDAQEIIPPAPQEKIANIDKVKNTLNTVVIDARGEKTKLTTVLAESIEYDLMKYIDNIEDLIAALQADFITSQECMESVHIIRNDNLFKNSFNQDLNNFLEYIASKLKEGDPNCKITIV
jgi:hypothetical protein